MEDEAFTESGHEYRSIGVKGAPPSPEGKLTQSKLERHNRTYGTVSRGLSGSMAASSRGGGRGGDGSHSDAGTKQSSMSVAESIISRATARKGKF